MISAGEALDRARGYFLVTAALAALGLASLLTYVNTNNGRQNMRLDHLEHVRRGAATSTAPTVAARPPASACSFTASVCVDLARTRTRLEASCGKGYTVTLAVHRDGTTAVDGRCAA